MRTSFVVAVGLAIGRALGAQSGQTELERNASAQFQTGQWTEAATSYAAVVKERPGGYLGHFRLGVSLLRSGRAELAIPHFAEAARLGLPAPQAAYFTGKAYAALGRRDEAFRDLERATKGGFAGTPVPPAQDADLRLLSDDPRFRDFIAALTRNATPCLTGPKYREFDFWIGEWDVRPNGQPSAAPATNIVKQLNDGCVIEENWNAPGSTGESFNIYDASVDKWNQTWVDNSGGLHVYWGNLRNGNMVFEGDLAPLPGTTARVHTRLTFFPVSPDTVRQFSERTLDGGKTWTTNYDFIYTRRKL